MTEAPSPSPSSTATTLDLRTELARAICRPKPTTGPVTLSNQLDAVLAIVERERSGGNAQGSIERDAIAQIIDPDCAAALISERKWCEQYGKNFEVFADGYIQRWARAVAKADTILSLTQPTQGGDKGEAGLVSIYVDAWEKTIWATPEAATDIVAILAAPQPAGNAYSAKGPAGPLQCLRCGTVDAFGPVSAEKK